MNWIVRVTIVVSCLISVLVLSSCGGGGGGGVFAQPTIPRLTITTATLPNGTSDTPYSQTIQASGGVAPFNWSVSGVLPHNMALGSSTTGTDTISGTPDTAAQGMAFTIEVRDSANQSAAQSYTVSILGEPDTLTLSPPSLTFAPQLTGGTSIAQTETVSNTGASGVMIVSVAATGTNAADFSQSTTCGPNLAAGANCSINVTFTPSQIGPRSAAITITDNTVGSPHSVSLGGVGLTSSPNATLSATSLAFGTHLVGSNNAVQSLTLSNYGTATLNIAGITATANFSETNTCGASLASGANCDISVTFTPSTTGPLNGTLSVTDNAPGGPQTVSLSGTGTTTIPLSNGYCGVSNGMLNGTCYVQDFSPLPFPAPSGCSLVFNSASCPAGAQADLGFLGVVLCGPHGSVVSVDHSRPCH